MAVTGRTGADAIFRSIQHICRVVTKFAPKLNAVIAAAVAASVITSDEALLITTFLSTLTGLCLALEKLASYSGF